MPLIDLAGAKKQLNVDSGNTTQDDELADYIAGVALAVDEARGEAVEQRTVVDELTLCQASVFLLATVPVLTLTSVATIDGATSWDVAGLHVAKASGRVSVLSGPPVDGAVLVTYTAGYADADIPANYKLAARIILQHLWETQRGTQGALAGAVAGSDEVYDPRYSYSIPRRALELLGAPLPGVA